jgi:hypothetical protein
LGGCLLPFALVVVGVVVEVVLRVVGGWVAKGFGVGEGEGWRVMGVAGLVVLGVGRGEEVVGVMEGDCIAQQQSRGAAGHVRLITRPRVEVCSGAGVGTYRVYIRRHVSSSET